MKPRLAVLAVLAAIVALAALLGRSGSCTQAPALQDAGTAPVTSPELRAKLHAATRAKGAAYVARTKHKQPDGAPIYANRLVLETSPYLLQHAHNPVDWFPWGDEAFETARRLGRPVLLSIGYSTCHWCHVMEEESFEDEEVARTINERYVAIKVDREERPDVDAIYMSAVQSLTGGGGWPMTVWLTPDRKPFYAGTYFPPRTFVPLLEKLKITFDEDPSRVASTAERLVADIRRQMTPDAGGAPAPNASSLDAAASLYRSRFDAENGGMRGAPKFPSSLPVRFLLRDHRRRATDTDSLRMATVTLERMSRGGIHDQLGGGFHRYSTDERWVVPHFEKMLYDNALLAIAYLEGFLSTRREGFAAVAKGILAYVAREMTSPDGAFFSATDADSLDPRGRREEGWFFTWTQPELDSALGVHNARIVGSYYGVTSKGDLDGRSVLHVPRSAAEVAKDLGTAEASLRSAVQDAQAPLLAARAKRPPPLRDEKILTSWNALMISAHARAALALGDAAYAERAERAADFLLRTLVKGDRLLRTYNAGAARLDAYLDDYAFLVAALLDLHEATGRLRWLTEAIRLDAVLERHFEDKAGGFFTTSDDHEQLLARDKPSYDGAEPSGASVEALNLLRLHELTTRDGYRARAERCLANAGPVLASSPTALSEMLLALDFASDVPKEIVIVTPHDRAEAEPFLAKLREVYLPNRVLVVVPEGEALEQLAAVVPLVASKAARDGKSTAYVCERRTCELPTTDPTDFARQVARRAPPPPR
jgi:uncharacterized protein YyaL (SSP411 family)